MPVSPVRRSNLQCGALSSDCVVLNRSILCAWRMNAVSSPRMHLTQLCSSSYRRPPSSSTFLHLQWVRDGRVHALYMKRAGHPDVWSSAKAGHNNKWQRHRISPRRKNAQQSQLAEHVLVGQRQTPYGKDSIDVVENPSIVYVKRVVVVVQICQTQISYAAEDLSTNATPIAGHGKHNEKLPPDNQSYIPIDVARYDGNNPVDAHWCDSMTWRAARFVDA